MKKVLSIMIIQIVLIMTIPNIQITHANYKLF